MPISRRNTPEIEISNGYIVDSRTGLLIPSTIRKHDGRSIGGLIGDRLESLGVNPAFNPGSGYYSFGYHVEREQETLIPRYNAKGSIASELMLAAIADGEIANVGISPIVYSPISSVLQNQIAKSKSATMNIAGRQTPVRTVSRNISRFNDSVLGFAGSMERIIYSYRVYNRGQPIATIPIEYSHDLWENYGMEAIPIVSKQNRGIDQYYLTVDWEKLGRNPIPYLPDPLRCTATGNNSWPYWYRTEVDGKAANVLLHSSHIIPMTPGESAKDGLGTSALWQCLGFLSDYFLVLEHKTELKLNHLSSGFIGVSGVDVEADAIRAEMELEREEQINEGRVYGSEYVIFASDERDIKFSFLPLRQGDDVQYQARKEDMEDMLAMAFGEPLSAIVMRGGMGLGSRMSETSADEAADSGVYAIFNAIEIVLEAIYGSVEINISLPNNRAKRQQLNALETFARAIKQLPEETLTNAEIRAIIDRDLLEIPDTEDIINTTDGNDEIRDDNDNQETSSESDDLFSAIISCFEPFLPVGSDEPIPSGTAESEAVSDDRFDENFPDEAGMLDGDNWEDREDTNPTPEEDDFNWYWALAPLLFFRRTESEPQIIQRVGRERTRTIRDSMAAMAIIDSDLFSHNLATGRTSLQSWVNDLEILTQTDFTHAFRMGIGGRTNIGSNEAEWLDALIGERFDEIESLAEIIARGELSELQVANYARNIVSGSVAAYEAANSTNYGFILGSLELPEYPGDGNQICRGNCRCHWSLLRDGDVVFATWVLDSQAQHCASCLANADRWKPLLVELEL